MAEFEQIISIRKGEIIHGTGIRFFTHAVAKAIGFESLVNQKADPSKKYAIAVAYGESGLILKGALVNVDQNRYKTDPDYMKDVNSRIDLLFNPPSITES